MSEQPTTPVLRYIPLGGLGEVGMNMWALELGDDILVVDCGLMFPQEDMLGVDLVIPDISYLLRAGKRVRGIVLTHGHEDHVGALPFVLKQMNVPVYATRLTLGLVRGRLKEHRFLREADLREVAGGDQVQLGPFRVEMIPVSHSIPDAMSVAVHTELGVIIYTSDFKLDVQSDGQPGADISRFRELGDQGVLLLLSDSTNAEREGHAGQESDLIEPLRRIMIDAPGRVIVASFASNIQRVQHVIALAHEQGRKVAVAGRSLQTNVRVSQELGYLRVPSGSMIPLESAEAEPRLVLLTAGAQGEPVAAMARFAARQHPVVNVREGDWMIISARPIPGNERLVQRAIDNLYRHGARVFYSEREHVHVSGHAHRDELRMMLEAVRPRNFIPVHGSYRQLHHHAELALSTGLDPGQVQIVEDGQSVDFDSAMRLGPVVHTGLVYVDGLGIGDVEQMVLRDRKLLAQDGMVLVAVALERQTGRIRSGPEVISRGFIDPSKSADLVRDTAQLVARELGRLPHDHVEVTVIAESIRESVSQYLYRKTHRRPMIVPLISEL